MARHGWKVAALGLAIAAVHYGLYLSLWGAAFAMGERVPGVIPGWLRLTVLVLGIPLMTLPDQWFIALRPALGDDANSLFVVAALNALLWGGALAWLLLRLGVRRRARSRVSAA